MSVIGISTLGFLTDPTAGFVPVETIRANVSDEDLTVDLDYTVLHATLNTCVTLDLEEEALEANAK